MTYIIIEIVALVAVVGFLIYLAKDDKKNRLLREAEDREEALRRVQTQESE